MTPGARVRPAQVAASTDTTIDVVAVGAAGSRPHRAADGPCRLGKRIPPAAVPRDAEQTRARRAGERARRSRSNASRRPSATRRAASPRWAASTNRSGSGACPYRDASADHRSRHAAGVASGTSRCAPASQTRRPRPWHDAIRVVPAATGRQPPAAGVPVRHRVDEPGRLAHRGRRHPQVRERIPGVGIGAVLGDDQVGPERGGQLGEQRPDGRQPRALTGPGLERHVDRGPRGAPLAQLPDVAGPREEVAAGLVERQGQDAGVLPVDRLDAVAVVDVEVDIQDAKAVAARACDGQGRDRRRCRTRTRGRASRGGARRPGGRHARRRRGGSPRPPGAIRRRPSPRPRASRRTADRRRPRRCPPRSRRTAGPRTA